MSDENEKQQPKRKRPQPGQALVKKPPSLPQRRKSGALVVIPENSRGKLETEKSPDEESDDE